MPLRVSFFIAVFALSTAAFAQSEPEQVRIRLVKNLDQFPQIAKAQVKQINSRLWILKGARLQFQNQKLSEQTFVVKNEKQKFDIVGQFDFDRYLSGVIASEMPDRWPEEALNAQAVVARSFAMARMQERSEKIYQLDADQMDQVFQDRNSARAMAAVQRTRGIILKAPNGKVLKAYFHSDCGGQTVPASKVWPGEIDTGTAFDPWCQARRSNTWSFAISQRKFLEILKQNQNAEIAPGEAEGEKLQALRIDETLFSIQKLRQIFGFSKIKNSPQSVEFSDGKITLKGQGYGHGVGLCQWGAYEQSKRGFNGIQILKHYYPRAEIALDAAALARMKTQTSSLVSR